MQLYLNNVQTKNMNTKNQNHNKDEIVISYLINLAFCHIHTNLAHLLEA